MNILAFSFISISIMFIPNVVLLREVLYSIFVGNLGNGKHNRKKADKIHRTHSLYERVTFSYVIPYLCKYRKDFDTYAKLTILYLVVSIVAVIILIIVGIYKEPLLYIQCWGIFAIMNFIFFTSIACVARVGSDHKTKYDRD